MSRAEQQEIRREIQGQCTARYTGAFRLFTDAQCKLRIDHESDHRTWRQGAARTDGVLFIQWQAEMI